MTRFPAWLTVIVLASCAPPDAAEHTVSRDTLPGGIERIVSHSPADSGRWHLIEVARIRNTDGAPGSVGRIRDVALAEDGTMLVADVAPLTIHVFDSSGVWLHDIGRAGSGPGEFEDAFIALIGDTLLVQDRRNSRVNRFLIDGTSLDALPSACCLTEGIGVASGGRVLVPAPGTPERRKWVLVTTGRARDSIALVDPRIAPPRVWNVRLPNGEGFGKLVPMVPAVRTAIDPAGTLVVAWSGEYILRRTVTGSDTVLLFGRDVPEGLTLTAAGRQRIVRELARTDAVTEGLPVALLADAYDPDLLPEHPELFDMLWVDDAGRTWVQRTGHDTGGVRLDLFGPDGRWLDTVELPVGGWPTNPYFRPVDWTGDQVVVAVDDDTGPLVIRYRVARR